MLFLVGEMGKISQPDSVTVIYWVLEQIKPGISLKAELTKLKLSYSEHIKRKQGSLGKTVKVGKTHEAGNEETDRRWTDSTREAIGLRKWAGLLRTEHYGHHSITGPPESKLIQWHIHTHSWDLPIIGATGHLLGGVLQREMWISEGWTRYFKGLSPLRRHSITL